MCVCVCVRVRVHTVRAGFLHLAEALAYRRDSEVAVRAVIDMLKSGERCNPEAELIGKGRLRPHSEPPPATPTLVQEP